MSDPTILVLASLAGGEKHGYATLGRKHFEAELATLARVVKAGARRLKHA